MTTPDTYTASYTSARQWSRAGVAALVAAMLLTLATALHAQESRNWYARYKNTDLPMLNLTTGNAVPIDIKEVTTKAIIFKTDWGNEAEIPLDNDKLQISYRYPPEWNQALVAINGENYSQAVELLRPIAYPMLKYLYIPEDKFNGHGVVEKFYEALVKSGSLDEAIRFAFVLNDLDLMNRLASERFMEYTVLLAHGFIEDGRSEEALRALEYVPLSKEREELIPQLMDFASTLRRGGNIEESLQLYKRIKDIPDTDYTRTALLWSAYCNILLENYTAAELFLKLVPEIDRDEDDYSLLRLVTGRFKMVTDTPQAAMGDISEGVVFSDMGNDWMPDLLYVAGKNYRTLGEEAIAANVYYELRMFFPETYWGELAAEEMKTMPPRQELGESQGSNAGVNNVSENLMDEGEFESTAEEDDVIQNLDVPIQ